MKERKRFISLCLQGLENKGLADERYKQRLKKEIKAVDEQAEHEYYLNLYDEFKREEKIFPENEHNNLVDYVLGLAPTFDIEKESAYVQGESPDIDIDYIKAVRDYLSGTWAAQTFGQENICQIGTYGTSGIKGAIQDNARVYGNDVHEVQSITTKMEDKDDEGELLDWDKALEIYSDFAAYCEKHKDIAEAAKLLQGRNRTAGVHAGGLIISNQSIDGFVPLEVRKVNKDNPNGVICSAWTEGQATQDLQPVGLIKFDLLVINNLMQIALACYLAKKRHGLDNICALPGMWDWSDTTYLNDPKVIEMANRGDLKCIFQFDSDGMRKLVKRGGVTSFEDLPAYSSLYRPGPLMCFSVHSKIKTIDGEKTVKELLNWHDRIAYVNREGEISYTHKFAIWKTGKKKMLKIKTRSGKELMVSPDHRILSESGFKKSESFEIGEKIAISKL